MARKRKPLVFSGESVELDAPGLEIRQRNNGACDLYWIASAEARKRGYLPRTVRLYFDLKDLKSRQDLEQRCKLLTSEMLAWVGDPERQKKPVYDGTVAALIRCYQTDENSPYRGLAQTLSVGMTIGVARSSARSASVELIGSLDRICETASLLSFSQQPR